MYSRSAASVSLYRFTPFLPMKRPIPLPLTLTVFEKYNASLASLPGFIPWIARASSLGRGQRHSTWAATLMALWVRRSSMP